MTTGLIVLGIIIVFGVCGYALLTRRKGRGALPRTAASRPVDTDRPRRDDTDGR